MTGVGAFLGRLSSIALAGAVLTGCVGVAVGDNHFTKHFATSLAATGVQRLVVTSGNGDVRVTAASVDRIEIRALIQTNDIATFAQDRVAISRSGSDETVSSQCPNAYILFWGVQNCGIDFDIRYPKTLQVSVRTSNGDITVIAAAAPVEAQTTNGDVTINAARSDVVATSHQGDVIASIAPGWQGTQVSASTTFGDVELTVPSGFHGGIATHTIAGSVEGAAQFSGAPVARLSTTFGDVTVRHEPSANE